jgi:hypothetical protein
MPGIPREVIEHHLKIYPDAKPVQQRPLKQSVERQNFIHEEIKKLLDAGFIREVHYPCGGPPPLVAGQSCGRPEGQWEASDVHRLHKSQQGMSQRPFSSSMNRPDRGFHLRL